MVQRLGWAEDHWRLTFQSRLGPAEWLRPYTDDTLEQLAQEGVKTLLVAQPGFASDCLETIDEIGYEGAERFRQAGGETLIRVPCVNDDPAFVEVLRQLVLRETQGWR